VLDQMSDADIRLILGMMGDRQAAAILAAFPPARAAAISRGARVAPGDTL
jgi:flagellar motility protein MotE (MotC chaperone)